MHHSKSLISVAAFLLALPAFAAPPANSPYNTDNVDKFVHEQSAAAFKNVEEILCYVGQMKGESFINQGVYKALIDNNLCESGETQGQSSNGSNTTANSNAPEYEPVTVNVTQAGTTDPVVGSVWVHPEDLNGAAMPAKLTTTATPSDTNPWGIFSLNWGFTGMQGFIQTSKDAQNRNILQYTDSFSEGAFSENRLASLLKTGETSGKGSISDGTHSFDIAFDENHFLRSKDNDQQCFARKEYTSNVWRYGLYDATSGERITRNSGFPIKKGDDWGWAGYWGVWLPGDANVQTGETVQRASFDGTTGQSYTVFKAEGKLTKH
ncbi:MAG: hypothetical protein KJ914_11985, partial [Gammaproteobacteria bacterium]|nr:hypothetical protein [Gammaproteobacteria bacterium]MBU2006072.1 hypothetical protein [Gammaproteobacteria bacterium]